MIGEGTRLAGRYEMRQRLGGGGAGDVWLAHDEALERFVAVKVLRQDGTDVQQRFTDEIRAQAPLAHHSIVRVFDAGRHEQTPFLVMAYVPGQPLSTLLLDGALPAGEVLRLGHQIAEALAHAHSQGVVHRDVKPGNVLVADDGQAYLTDFGIARRLDSDRVTAPNSFVGSAAYVAPEQVRGEVVTATADVYSLGLVLLEALTGHHEYPGPAIEAATARLHRPPRVPPDLPPPWPELLTHMTAADPAARFTASEVATRLARAGGSDGMPTAGVSWAGSGKAEAATLRHRTSRQAVQPAVPAELVADDDGSTPDRAGRASTSRTRSRWRWVAIAAIAAVLAGAGGATAYLSTEGAAPAPQERPASLDEALERLEETITS